MEHRRSVILWTAIVGTALGLYWGALLLVDPLGIWGAPVIRGFNNCKVGQPLTLDLWKPYQYRMVKPDVVFLGSSRVYVGLAPKDYPDKSARVYNMGMSSLSLKDALAYVQFMVRTHKPGTIYLGLDFFKFGAASEETVRSGFSQKRLDEISRSELSCFTAKLEETAGTWGQVHKTVQESRAAPDVTLFERGWDVKRGSAGTWNPEAWKHSLRSFMKTYDSFVLSEESFRSLANLVSLCHEEGIKLRVFFNPISEDLIALIHLTGRYGVFEEIKRRVASIVPFRDFAVPGDLTANRKNFYDASHYRADTGMRHVLRGWSDEVSGLLGPEQIGLWLASAGDSLTEAVKRDSFDLLRNGLEAWRRGDGKAVTAILEKYVGKIKEHEGD